MARAWLVAAVASAAASVGTALPLLQSGPPDGSARLRRAQLRQVGACWRGADPDERSAACCSNDTVPPDCTFSPIYSQERCCLEGRYARQHPAEGRPDPLEGCGEADEAFLHRLESFYHSGGEAPREAMPSALAAEALKRPSEKLIAIFTNFARAHFWDLEQEVQRCAPAALGQVALATEIVAASEQLGPDVIGAGQETVIFLFNTLKSSGRLPESSMLWPNRLLVDAMQRLSVLRGLLTRDTKRLFAHFLRLLAFHPRSNATDCFAQSPTGKDEVCGPLLLSASRELHSISLVLLAPMHLDFARRAGRPYGEEVVVLSQLLGAARLDGVQQSNSQRLLAGASAGLALLPHKSRNRRRLEAASERLAQAIAAKAEMNYAEIGKESILRRVLERLGGPWNKTYVEIGVGNGCQCNSRFWRQYRGWTGVMLDQVAQNEDIGLYRRLVAAENINEVFDELAVPAEPDLLSIDVDSNDFWFWRALDERRYRPRLVNVEHNNRLLFTRVVTRYAAGSELNFAMDSGESVGLLGSSAAAIVALGRAKGYHPVHFDANDVIFARGDIAGPEHEAEIPSPEDERAARLRRGGATEARVRHAEALIATGEFHVGMEEALRPGPAAALGRQWTPDALAHVWGDICSESLSGPNLCYPSR